MLNDFSGHPFQLQLSRELAKRSHYILHTYCASFMTPHGAIHKHNQDLEGLDVQAILPDKTFNKYSLLSRWLQERMVGKALVDAAKRFHPDIIISTNMPLGAQGVLLAFARKSAIPFIFWMQDIYSVGISMALKKRLPFLGRLFGIGFQWFERRLLCSSSHVVVISRDFLPFLPASVRQKRSTVIENWAPLDELPVLPKSNEWSRNHDLENKTCFLYSGTLGMKHNPVLLLELARKLQDRDDVIIVVISEGAGAEYLSKEATIHRLKNLLVLPFQPFESMPQVLASADILVAILEKEAGIFAVPSKVLTYLCARRPLLLAIPSDNLSAQIVNNHQAGLVTSPDELPDFLAAAQRLLENERLRELLADNGRSYAERNFEIENIADRFETIMESVYSGNRTLSNGNVA